MNSYSVDTGSEVENGSNKTTMADKEMLGSSSHSSSMKVHAIKKLLPMELQERRKKKDYVLPVMKNMNRGINVRDYFCWIRIR